MVTSGGAGRMVDGRLTGSGRPNEFGGPHDGAPKFVCAVSCRRYGSFSDVSAL